MARKPRLHVPGGLYHVRLRGNGGQDIFSNDEDRYHLY
jgi:putative transposase